MPFVPKLPRGIAVAHGGTTGEEGAEGVLDFSVSVNPFPPPPSVREEAAAADFTRYPDRSSRRLRKRLAELCGLEAEEILVTAGVTEALRLFGLVFVRGGTRSVVLGPTYGEYAPSCRMYGGEVREIRARAEDGFRPDLGEIERVTAAFRPSFLFLCDPNNPTGTRLDGKEEEFLFSLPSRFGTEIVLDEAYAAFACGETVFERSQDLVRNKGILVLRSMTKDYALPGLRLGYVAAPKEVVRELEEARQPWAVASGAEAAGLAALEEESYYRETWERTAELTAALSAGLAGLGIETFPTAANFILAKVDGGRELIGFLAERKIRVRDCASFGLPGCIRLGTKREKENRLLLEALGLFLEERRRG